MTNQSVGSARRARFARIQQHLIVALCGVAFAILFPHLSSAQQVAYYDFNTPEAASPSQTSTSCGTISGGPAANGVLFCFNYAGAGLSYLQDFYPPLIDPNASSDGDAGSNNYALQLTESASSQISSMWYSIPQNVADGFSVWYTVKLTPAISAANCCTADGLAFVIQNAAGGQTDSITNTSETGSGFTVLGGGGGAIGYGGIDNSVALEMDTFWDSQYDPYDGYGNDDNHIALQSCGPGVANSPAHISTPNCLITLNGTSTLVSNPTTSAAPPATGSSVYLPDGNPHQVVMVYNGPNDSPANYLYVYLDPAFNPGTHTPVAGSTPLFSGPFNIAQYINLKNGTAYVGFTAANGYNFEQHELMGFTFTPHNVAYANVCPTGQTTPAPCSATLPVTFNFAADTTIGSIQVVTQGATGLDFQLGSGSTCTGTISAGNSCTVNVTFAPIAPGLRMGAVQLLDGSGNVLATQLTSGIGQGPAVAFGPGTQTALVGINGVYAGREVALDGAGDIFVAENLNNQVVKLPAGGGAQTTVGTGLSGPYGVAVDGAGDIFIADTGNNRVVEVPAGGGPQTTVASGLNFPLGVAVDGAGDLYIADTDNNRVLELPAGGGPQTTVASGLNNPNTVAVDGAGDLFIVDSNSQLVEIPAGCASPGCQASVGSGLDNPRGAAVDAAGDVFIADTYNSRVVEVPAGCTSAACQTTVGTGFGYPWGVAVDGAGDVFITDTNDGVISEVNRKQPPSLSFDTTAVGATSADSPRSITLQNVGNQTLNAVSPGLLVVNGPNFVNVLGSGTPPDCSASYTFAPGQSCNLSLSFTPQIAGNPLSSTAVFNDNALNATSAQQTIALSGTGLSSNYSLVVSTAGSGTVTGANCSTASYASGTRVTCTATPAAGSQFTGWSGGTCSGLGSCSFSLSSNSAVIANFAQYYTLTVTEAGTGSGKLTDNLSLIGCIETSGSVSGTCTGSYSSGANVTLNATASGTSTFVGWGGACASSGTAAYCTVTMSSALSVVATFVAAGATQPGTLKPITAGVVYGQGGSLTTGIENNGGVSANSLDYLGGVAVDGSGNLYVADAGNNRVLFYPAGSTNPTRVYGQGGSLTTNTPNNGGVSANSLWNPVGVAVDGAGNLYVADLYNNRVLVYPAGSTTATRVYGQGGSFTANNAGVDANSLDWPFAVTLDGSGNLYVADYVNSRVLYYPAGSTTATRVYGQGGSFTSGAVNNGGLSANSLNQPTGVALDSSGDLYVADLYNNRVLFYPNGSTTATQVYGQGGSFTTGAINNGGVSANSLSNPLALTVDSSGDLYVVDRSNNRVLFYPFGSTTATRVYGQGGSFTSNLLGANAMNGGVGVSANSLADPYGIALDSSGNLYVSDWLNGRVLEYGTFGNVNVCPNGVMTPAPCSDTITLSYYAPSTTTFGATQVVTQGASGLDFSLGSGGTCTGTVSAGASCIVNVNFAPLAPGLRTGAVELFDNSANLLTTAPIYGIGQAPAIAFTPSVQAQVPTSGLGVATGIAVDGSGNVFISDQLNNRVLEVTPGGLQTVVATSGLNQPGGLALDGAGDLFIADAGNNRVVEVPAGGGIQITVASGLNSPNGVAVDGAFNVFIADSANGRVVEVPAGGGAQIHVASGLNNPEGIAVDATGNVFIVVNAGGGSGTGSVVEVPAGGGSQITLSGGFTGPQMLALDAAGDLFVADGGTGRIVELPAGGGPQMTAVSGLGFPWGVVVDRGGDLFLTDPGNKQVVEVERPQPPSLGFALTNAGSTSADSPKLVSVQNVGNQPLTGSLTLSTLGTNFTQNSTPDCSSEFPLAPGASCSESFSFTPQTTGYLTGTASFSDNTFNLSPLVVLQTINLSGNGGINGQAVGVAVPNVVGLTQAAAGTTITGAGLAMGTVSTAANSIVPSGSVIASNPAAGTQVNPGSAVRLLVSTGQAPLPTPNPLLMENNYFVTGDYASAGVTLRGTGRGGMATGTITIPDSTTNPGVSQGVPDGSDIIDAFLYWETLENTASPSATSGTFDSYSITGQQIGSDLPYTDGTFTGTLRAYRADVNTYLPVGANGVRFASGAFTVSLPDGGGSAFPLTEGASLVVIYRVLSQNFPLKAVVIYDGSAIPATSTTQNMLGFYDAAGTGESTTLFAAGGAWNNSSGSVALPGHANQFSAPLNAGNAFAAVILSAPVNNSDNDGILDAWKSGPAAGDFYAGEPGYYDAKTGTWVPLPGALHGEKDLFVQLDYMCGAVLSNGSCDPSQENLFPAPDAQGNDPLAIVTNAFAADGVVLHLAIGNAVPESTCTDNTSSTPPQLCQFPSEPGVIGWKNSLEFSKLWPRNLAACAAGGDCSTRFPYGQKDSYHYVLVGHSLAIPAWNTRYGTLTSIQVVSGVTTIVTANRGTGVNECPSRITIAGVLGDPSLNGVYNTASCPDAQTITVTTPGVPNWSYPNNTLPEPAIGLTSGTVTSISGYSDLGGADSAVTLGLWETAPNQNMSTRANVIAGTLFHEIGHTLGLSHGGLYYNTPGSYIPTFDANCKPNYQSVMNYLFQLDGVGPNAAVAYSNQTLATLNESSLGSVTQLTDGMGNPATFPTSAWYTSNAPSSTASAATLHCDGTPLTGDTGYRVNGPIAPITPAWSNGQNITFDGQSYTQLLGYNDLANLDLRQVGATGGEFASLASVLSFGSSTTPLNVAAGGSVAVGAGGTVTLGSGGTVTLGSGGNATVGAGSTITPGNGGSVTLNNGASVTLSTGGTVTLGSGGTVALGSGGTVTLGSGGSTITLGSSGGTVTLGSGGTITLGSGGTITSSAGTVTIPSTGGTYALPAGGGIVALGSGGIVALGSGGTVALGSGGIIALGSGGTVTLGSGGTVALGSGGIIALGSGGTVALGSGGNVTLGSGGIIALGSGGTVTLGSGGTVTLGSGGTVTLGSGGDVSVGAGGIVALGSGGTVTLGSGGTVALGSGGNATLSSGGTVALGSGGTVTLGSGATVTLGSGGATINGVTEPAGTYTVSSGGIIALGSGGTVTLGSGGNVTLGGAGTITLGSGGTVTLGSGGTVTLGSGGVVALGSGGTVALGSGGTIALGSGGTVTLGSGGESTTELTYQTANSIVRPPSSPTETQMSTPAGTAVVVNWTAPVFGVVNTYTISRSSDGGAPIVIGSVSGVNGYPPATTFTDTNPDLTSPMVVYTISTTLLPVAIDPTQRQSAPSPPAVLTNNQTIVLGSLPSSVSISTSPITVTATAQTNGGANGLQVNFSATGTCAVGSQSINAASGVSSASVTLNSTGSCTITASQPGSNLTQLGNPPYYNAANSVSGTFTIVPQGSNTQSQSITFPQLPNVQYGNTFSLSASSSSGLTVSFAASGPCTTSGSITGVGVCAITASAPANSTYSAASVVQSFTIYPAVLKVTANNLTGTYGQALPPLTSSYSGFVNNESASMVSGAPALSTTATAGSNAGSYPITVSTGTLAAANYSFLYVSGTLTIGKATATINVTPYSVTYNGKPHTATGTATGVGGVALAGLNLTTTTTHTAAATYTDTWTFTDTTGNYNNASGTITDTILAAQLTITASSAPMIYGGPVPPITPAYSGFVNNESASNLTAQPICTTSATSSSPVGTYVSSCSNASDSNYSISYVAGTVQVGQATSTTAVTSSSTGNTSSFGQSVSFTATVTPQYSGTTPTGTVTFYDNGSQIGTGTLSQGQATFSTSSLPAGTADSITAIYSGDGNFTGSTSPAINQTVRATPIVSLSPLFVSFGNQNVNTTSSGIKITLTNIGDAALTPITIGLSGEFPGDFTQTNNCPSSLGYTAPNNSCTITVVFAPVDTGALQAALTITSNDDGSSGSQQYVALAGGGVSTIAGGSLFSDAIFATAFGCDSVVMRGGSSVDSFDSSLGFSSSHTLSGGNVGANGTVTLSGANTAIYGAVSVWNQNCSQVPSGFTSNGGGQPTGGLGALNGPGNYPAPPLPNTPPISTQNISGSCGSIAGCTNTGTRTVTLAPGTYGNLSLSGGTTAYLSAGTYNINSLVFSGNSVLYVSSGPVYVNIAGASLNGGNPALDFSGGTMQNPTQIPSNLQFSYAGSQGVNLSGGSGSYATVYAPNAPVNLSGGSDFFGSIVGSVFTNSGGVALHYDRHLAAIKAGNYIWFNAVINNVKGLPSGSNPAQVKLYMTDSTINFTANGTSYSVPVPNAVVTFNSTTALGAAYSMTSNRWSTSIPAADLTGNTFVAGVAFQVPANFPAGIQNVSWSAAFSTDTPGITLQWQWGAAVYTSFSTTYATSTNSNALGVNPEDGAADPNGKDPAGTPETYKADVVFGATGCGSTDYAGHLTSGAGVVPSLAPVSVSPSSLDFGTQAQGTTSTTPLTAVLTNNDTVAYTISSITITGTDAGDFAATNNCPVSPNTLASGASCTISVNFTPGDVGTRTAKVNISDGASNSPQTVYLTGTGH